MNRKKKKDEETSFEVKVPISDKLEFEINILKNRTKKKKTVLSFMRWFNRNTEEALKTIGLK